MIKQTITFDDFDGNEVSRDLYFHLSKKEIIDWQLDHGEENLGEYMERVVKSGNAREIISMFELFISKSYGIRDPNDSTKFTKTPEIAEEFMKSMEYDAFFGELLSNTGQAIKFVNGIFPKDLAKMIAEAQSEGDPEAKLIFPQLGKEADEDQRSGLKTPRDAKGNLLPWAFRKPSSKEMHSMTKAQLVDVTNRLSSGWQPVVESVEA